MTGYHNPKRERGTSRISLDSKLHGLPQGSAVRVVTHVDTPITTRSVSEVQLVPRLRVGLGFARTNQTVQFPIKLPVVISAPLNVTWAKHLQAQQ